MLSVLHETTHEYTSDHLVRQAEKNSVGTGRNQYMEYIHAMEEEDLGVMSEFMVMAATLLDIKCKMLLPKEVNEEGEGTTELGVAYLK